MRDQVDDQALGEPRGVVRARRGHLVAEVHRGRAAKAKLGEHEIADRLPQLYFALIERQPHVQPHPLQLVELLDLGADGGQRRANRDNGMSQFFQDRKAFPLGA